MFRAVLKDVYYYVYVLEIATARKTIPVIRCD